MNDDRTLHSSGENPESSHRADPSAREGARLGPYVLRHRIGTGGMGEVWRADQEAPIRRTVALKLIKAGMDSREVLARFEAERQALALMDHPCIARVFDAGTTPHGRPFFAMEYVQGIPINEYCDRRRLDTRARLELFQKVCHAVGHAHQKSVVHRDLKPSNILVADVDAQPSPKVIDFGVAKATIRKLTERTMATSIGQMIGTPEYMSPEQAELTNEDVDTRTDVYSLGVILYEILVGALPFEAEELRRGGLEGMLRILREEDPPKPSTRLSALGASASKITQSRRTDTRRLSGQVRGDLDWIVMRALEKDRNRRYASPAELAQDIQRHLDDQPVQAGPPTAGYRMGKFVRRHRAGVAMSTFAVLGLAAFAVLATLQATAIARERDRATAEAAKAEAMNDFLTRTLASADPWRGGSRDVTVVELLDAAVEEVATSFADQPAVEASMHTVLGDAYLGLGRLVPATEQVTRALEIHAALGEVDPRALASLYGLESRVARAANDYPKAVEAATAAVERTESDPSASLGERVEARQYLTRSLLYAQRFDEADSLLTITEALASRLEGSDRRLGAENLSQRADLIVLRDGDAAVADSLSRAAYDHMLTIDPDSPRLAVYMNNAAQYRSRSGDYEGALADFDRALQLYEQHFGTDHPEYATCVENRGGVLYRMGRAEETLAALETTYQIRARNLGSDHIDAIRTRINVGTVAMITGENQRAVDVYRELRPRLIEARGTDHPDVLAVLRNEGLALRGLERSDEGLVLFDQALEIAGRMYEPDHPRTALAHGDRGVTLMALERYDEARAALLSAFDVFLEKSGVDHPRTVAVAQSLVTLGEKTGDPAMAARYREYAEQ